VDRFERRTPRAQANGRKVYPVTSVYDFTAKTLGGKDVPLGDYRGQVLLIVNTASKCGFTPQYEGLEKLYEDLHPRGLTVLGFPCNQFGAQEPGGESEIGEFCQLNYGVSFPMFAKIDVNGPDSHPLYKFLTREKRGVLGTPGIKWNFTKFLIDRTGKVVGRFGSTTKPQDIRARIEKLF
jgi:glutathione peroxidase